MHKLIYIFLFVAISIFAGDSKNEKNLELESLQAKDSQAKDSMNNWLNGVFGLQPHKPNYILPYGYRENAYASYDGTEYENIEAELQVSLKLSIGSDLFGFGEKYYLAYSHKAFWQIYTESSPFRETNYNPEGFVVFPIFDKTSMFQVRSFKAGIAHESNGQPSSHNTALYKYTYQDPDNQSRSINYIYGEVTLQHDTLVTAIRVRARLPEAKENDDNPDYMDYFGLGEVKFNYFAGKHMFSLMGRGSLITNKGALEITHSYPLINDAYLYTKIFSGYGESLIDYNNYITKFSIGFSFSR